MGDITCVNCLSRNPSNADTLETLSECPAWGALISGVVIYAQDTLGTTRSVRIRVDVQILEVSTNRDFTVVFSHIHVAISQY